MQWDDLRIFLAVAREGSISGAAKRMSVEHSTVSRRMKALESQLGTRIIERKKSGYELTEAGEELKLAAVKMEIEAFQIEGVLAGQENRAAGELRVTAINNMASSVLMPIFASFNKNYPNIHLHLQVSNKFARLAERDADIAIRLTNSPTETLVGTKLTTVASAIYGQREYLNNLKKGAAEPQWLGVECCTIHQTWTNVACPEHNQSFFVDDTLLTLAALREGLGLAYLPCFMGDRESELERFRAPDQSHNLGLWLLYHPDLRRTKRVVAFRQHMIEKVGQLAGLFEGRASG